MTAELQDYHLPCGCHRTTHRDEQGEPLYTDEATCETHLRPIWEKLTPKGTHMNTPHPGKRPAPQLPANVTEVTIKRLRYTDGSLALTVKGDEWGMNVITTDAELLERIKIIANAMEELK